MAAQNQLINVPILLAAKEFRSLYFALLEYAKKTNQNIDINLLIQENSVEEGLVNQGINLNADIGYITALDRANLEYHTLWDAHDDQPKLGKRY
jgi:hypothetical protein